MSSQLDPIDRSHSSIIKECFACKAQGTISITRNDRTLMSCSKPSCIEKVEEMVVSLCAMDSRGF